MTGFDPLPMWRVPIHRPQRQEVAAWVAAYHVEREATRLLDRRTGAPAGPLSLARG